MNFSAGDSVQGLFKSVQAVLYTFFFIENLIFPYNLRCGFGQGIVNEQLINRFITDDTNAYDGKAYHLARSGINLAKKNGYKIYINSESNKDFSVNSLINDDKYIFMTLTRRAIYSMINIMDPIVIDNEKIDFSYFDDISIFIKGITNYYRERSRVNKKARLIDDRRFNLIKESDVSNLITQSRYNLFDGYDIPHNNKIDILSKNESTISAEVREILVKLTESTYQNVSSMIKTSNMDELRTKYIAKLMIIKHFYEGVPL
jgi:hypothetical protein